MLILVCTSYSLQNNFYIISDLIHGLCLWDIIFWYSFLATSKDLVLGYSSFINEIAICMHVYENPSNGWHFIDRGILF